MSDLLDGGVFDKYLVLKHEDIQKYTKTSEITGRNFATSTLAKICERISSGRIKDGKNPYNQYLVINADEPYAPEIVEILKRNGHWG